MSDENNPEEYRKPRLALMGEFSAGKSTLSNLLLGADPLPVQVTATRLPPVWLSYGENPAMREDIDGNSYEVDITQLDSIDLDQTKLIRLQIKADILKLCDLIDMPGISDPNMSPEVWQAVIGEADNVIWCTHATQAWRQSEAAVWESISDGLKEKSLLLLTRFDKLLSTRDRDRVVTRVKRETKGLFHKIYPVSLTQALSAGQDSQTWDKSGAEPFVKCLVDMLVSQQPDLHMNTRQADRPTAASIEVDQSSDAQVLPSRVKPKPGATRRPRKAPMANVAHLSPVEMAEMSGNI